MKNAILFFAFLLASVSAFSQVETRLHPAQIGAGGATNAQILQYNSTSGKWEPVTPTASTDDQKVDTFTIVSNVLRLSLESDAEPFKSVNLAPYLDNTDAQDLSLTGNTLSLTGDGTTVDLSGYLDNTDAQALGYTANTGVLTLTGSASVTIKVSDLYTVETFSSLTTGNTVTVTATIPTDRDGFVVSRNGVEQSEGASLDYTVAGQVITFVARNFEHSERVKVVIPK